MSTVQLEASPFRIGVQRGFYVIQECDPIAYYWRPLGKPTGDYGRALAEFQEYETAWRQEKEKA